MRKYGIHLLGFAFFKATFSISVSGKWIRFSFKMSETVAGIKWIRFSFKMSETVAGIYLKSMTRQFNELFNLIFGGFWSCRYVGERTMRIIF